MNEYLYDDNEYLFSEGDDTVYTQITIPKSSSNPDESTYASSSNTTTATATSNIKTTTTTATTSGTKASESQSPKSSSKPHSPKGTQNLDLERVLVTITIIIK